MDAAQPAGGKPPAVPHLDLRPQTAAIRAELRAAMDRVIDDTAFILGPAVTEFERDLAAYCGAAECVGLNTGTSALHLAMQCVGVGEGDEVVVPAMSFIATAWPVLYLRARPVFVDIDPRRCTLDPARLAAAITPRTKAIVPVHLYGQCADMDPILEIAAARGIPVIEDCAQAVGAEYRGRRAGAMGRVGCFSFYPSKNLGGFGEGGAITTDDPGIAERARRLRDHAQTARYAHEEMGYNYRMDGLQGAVLGVKLKHLEGWNGRRRAVAAAYDAGLAATAVTPPAPCPDGRHIYHLYVIRDRDRDGLREALAARGIGTALHYPIPIHMQKPFAGFGVGPGALPATEELARTCVSLPMYPELTDAQVAQVIAALRELRPGGR